MATKHEKRSSRFKPAKKQRLLDKQELTINIRLMEFKEEGLASPLRGKTLPQKIAKNADYKTVLAAALKKRQNYDKTTTKPSSLHGNTNSCIPMANQLKPFLGPYFFCGKVQMESVDTHKLEIHRA